MRYVGRHRKPSKRLGRILAAIAAGLFAVLLIGSPAAAKPVPVHWGDTYSGLVQTHCTPGTSWQALDFGTRDKDWIYAGEVLDLQCGETAGAGTVAPQQSSATPAGWVAPVNACITSGYGWRWGRMHNGVDLSAGYGTAIRAAAAGTVSVGSQFGRDQYGNPTGAGYYQTVNHGGGVWTHYFHESRWAVTSGWVNAGQVIGYVGSTGGSSGPHLHFEARTGGAWGTANNPVGFLAARGVTLRWC